MRFLLQPKGSVERDSNHTLHALTAASKSPSKAAVRRLVDITLAGLRD